MFGPVEIRMKGTLARKTGSYTTRVIMMDYKTSSTYMRFTMHVVPRVSSEMQYMLGNHCFFYKSMIHDNNEIKIIGGKSPKILLKADDF